MKLLLFLTFLLTTSLWGSACGIEGSIEERIKNCNTTKSSFVLITRSEKNLEIYRDLKTGLIWGDRISSDFNHYGSQKACSHELADAELLKEVRWRLPTIQEFEKAASHGMKESISKMDHTFWTSSPVKSKLRGKKRRQIPSQVFLWDGVDQRTDTGDLKDAASVRCVGKS